MKHRCLYCSKVIDKSRRFCDDQCYVKYVKRDNKDKKRIPLFLLGIFGGIILVLIGSFMNSLSVMKGGIWFCAITLLIFPFATEETILILGYRLAAIIIRITAVILLVITLF